MENGKRENGLMDGPWHGPTLKSTLTLISMLETSIGVLAGRGKFLKQ